MDAPKDPPVPIHSAGGLHCAAASADDDSLLFPEGSGRNYNLFRWVFDRHRHLIGPELSKLLCLNEDLPPPSFNTSLGCLEVPVFSSGEAVMVLCAHSCGDTFAFEEVDNRRIRVMLREWTPDDSAEALEADEAMRDKTRRERALWAFLSSGGALPVRGWVISGLMLTRAAMDLFNVVLMEVARFHKECTAKCEQQSLPAHKVWGDRGGTKPNFRWINENAAMPWAIEDIGDDAVLVPKSMIQQQQIDAIAGAEAREHVDPQMIEVRYKAPLTSVGELRGAILEEALYDCMPRSENDTFGLFIDCASAYEGNPTQFEFDCHVLCTVLAAVGSSEHVRSLAKEVCCRHCIRYSVSDIAGIKAM